jgi:hypothetical protein
MDDASDAMLVEVCHFLQYLKERAEGDAFDGLALSGSALAGDWLSAEEEDAWKNL